MHGWGGGIGWSMGRAVPLGMRCLGAKNKPVRVGGGG